MVENENKSVSAFDVISKTFKIVFEKPALAIPFLFVGICNFLWLLAVYFSPRYPISLVMAPPIRQFFGDKFLHYPQNFVLLPKLYHFGELIIVCTVGLCLTAYALWMLRCVYEDKKQFFVAKGTRVALKNYIKMLIVFIGLYYTIKGCATFSLSLMRPLFEINPHFVLLTVPLEVIIITVIQACFFFVFPAFIIGERKFFKGIAENFMLFINNAGAVFVLIIIPSLLFIPSKMLFIYNPLFAQRHGYESICYIIAINIIVNVIADIYISLFAGVSYIEGAKMLTDKTIQENVGESHG
ncbi:hypothetical protein ACFL3D_02710 [Candidatus Omnitrophota bacterium]